MTSHHNDIFSIGVSIDTETIIQQLSQSSAPLFLLCQDSAFLQPADFDQRYE